MHFALCVCFSTLFGADFDRELKVQDFRGTWHTGAEFAGKKAVVLFFTGVECPLACTYAERLAGLAKKYEPRGVAFLAIDPNSQDSVGDLAHFAKKRGVDFPVCKDLNNALADRWNVERTPEVLVFDAAGKLQYRGRVDDQFGIGYQRPKPQHEYLKEALDAVLAGRTPTVAKTDAEGCIVGRARKPDASAAVTFSNQIARLFERRCNECHRTGQLAPFALTNYSEAAGWAEACLEMVDQRRMPPWHASPAHGKFANDARLTDDEIATLRAWVKAGAPEGDPKELPTPKTYVEGWRIPKPDLVVSIPKTVSVPATGEVAYQYFEVDPGFKEDRWVRAAEAKPGNPSVVHHIIVFVRPPGSKGFGAGAVSGVNDDWLVATAPGARPMDLPPGQAKKIPKGATLVFQMHYTPNGKAQTDRSSVGLVFADAKSVTQQVVTGRAVNPRFALKPKTSDQVVEASQRLDEDMLLLAMFPHMHLRGQAFRYEAAYPDGRRETLLDIPRYDFAWQNSYVLAEPKKLPAGTTIHCTAKFDNSTDNRSNPDPSATVRWGDQTWEEMMIGYFSATSAERSAGEDRVAKYRELVGAAGPQMTDELSTAAKNAHAKRTSASLDELQLALRKQMPQVDRIDVIVAGDRSMEILAATTRGSSPLRNLKTIPIANLQPRLGKLGEKAGIAEAAAATKTRTVELAGARGWDYKALSRSYGSCVHVPVRVDDKTAVATFWSKDAHAFPPEAAAFLESLVRTGTNRE